MKLCVTKFQICWHSWLLRSPKLNDRGCVEASPAIAAAFGRSVAYEFNVGIPWQGWKTRGMAVSECPVLAMHAYTPHR